MACLDLSPAITAIRARPEEFEFAGNSLHHIPSNHKFYFQNDGNVDVVADCGCSSLQTSRAQGEAFHTAYKDWLATYWHPVQINRQFASHFETPNLWRRLLLKLLKYLLTQRPHQPVKAVVPLHSLS